MCIGQEQIAVALSRPHLSSPEIVVMLESKMERSMIKWPKKG